jgi:hypothetical protein
MMSFMSRVVDAKPKTLFKICLVISFVLGPPIQTVGESLSSCVLASQAQGQ